jgi:hypothetical protein
MKDAQGLETLVAEIMECLKGRQWYAGLVLTLMLPDVCAALEAPNGKSNSDRYKAWFDTWLQRKLPLLSADDLYFLRCGVSHEAKFKHDKMKYKQVFFTLRLKNGFWTHMNEHQDALNLDLCIFCQDVIDSVEVWYEQNKDNRTVKKNLRHLVQFYPLGMLDFLNMPAYG